MTCKDCGKDQASHAPGTIAVTYEVISIRADAVNDGDKINRDEVEFGPGELRCLAVYLAEREAAKL